MILDINDLTKKTQNLFANQFSWQKYELYKRLYQQRKQNRYMKVEIQFLVNYSQTDKITLNGIDA